MEAFRGTIVHSTESHPMEILTDHLLLLNEGRIVSLTDESKSSEELYKHGLSRDQVTQLGDREFLIPGFVDTHIHAPQYVYTGTALDLPLLDWLNKYTFPIEASFSDPKFARTAYEKAVGRVLKSGTTTACWFATIHLEASVILSEIIHDYGQRAHVGKVNMNQNSPEFYCETTSDSLISTEGFIKKVQDLDSTLVSPIITPRFAPACDMELMQGLANLSRSYDLPIQSHISENKSEINWIKELYPQSLHYSDVYDRCGLFTNKTVMAHGIYLCDEELDLIVDRGVGIAHCPNSNTSLRSGLCDVRRLLDHGIKVGLGTDVSGGFSPSMLNAIRMSTQVSNTISMQKNKYEHLDYREAFRLATLGGSKVMGLDKEIGNFEKGKQFDALRINPYVIDSPYDLFKRDEIEDSIQKFFYLGDDRNITNVYVAGREVHARNHM